MNTENFRQRQARALGRRLNGNLTAKQLAYAVGVHADTVLNWSKGYSTMSGDAIEAVDAFFQSIGDWGFIGEIYGEIGVRRRQKAAQLERQAAELRQQAEWLSGVEAVA